MDNDKNIKKSQSSIEKMNSGSLWMSSASIISRILGVLYIIPWIKWMGTPQVANEANALFGIGYRWYALFLAVAVAGV
ncbi:polysaccharide biosynthesis protein, partial [Aerococcus viridans]